jgi:hypothetical protein
MAFQDLKGWQKLGVGVLALAVVIVFLSSGFTPPEPVGSVLENNRKKDIDASPLFYSDVENMQELEEGVQAMRDSALADTTDTATDSTEVEKAAAEKRICTTKEECAELYGE